PPADYSRGPWQHGRSYIRFQKPGFTPEMAADDQNHAKMAGEAARRYQQEQRQQRIQAEQQRMRGGRSFEGDQGRGFNEIDRMMRERPKPGLRPEDFGTDQSGALGVVPRHLRGIRTYEGRALQDLLRQMTPTLAEASHGASRMLGDPRLQMGVDFLANPGHYLESLADPVRSWWQTQQQDAEIDAWDYQHQTGKYRPMTAIRG
ncbi:MAG TPA: hypothetical protein VEI97_09015, partial [bacterium]|nr:hypothetical protein [bacterium]